MTVNEGTTTFGAPAEASVLAEAFADLQRHGWHLLTGLHQPGRGQACIDAVLIGPGGVLVLETAKPRRRQSSLAAIAAAVVAVVPGPVRRHVQSVVCLPAERGDADAVAMKPSVLAGFARSLPTVLSSEAVAAASLALRDTLASPITRQLWTVNKVLEWTKDAKGQEVADNRASRRRRARTPGPIITFLVRHAALLAVTAALLALAVVLGQ